jgi:hypothetical protein
MNEAARKYLAEIGRTGGQVSRRKLSRAEAQRIARARWSKVKKKKH